MQHAERIQRRLREVSGVPDTLAVSFDGFEMIRLLARQFRDQVPELFAAFMTTAGAAVDGREAVTAASSLPPPAPASPSPGGRRQLWGWMKSSASCPCSRRCWPTGSLTRLPWLLSLTTVPPARKPLRRHSGSAS